MTFKHEITKYYTNLLYESFQRKRKLRYIEATKFFKAKTKYNYKKINSMYIYIHTFHKKVRYYTQYILNLYNIKSKFLLQQLKNISLSPKAYPN